MNFDGITYAKGASVLKQLVAYVGREHFLGRGAPLLRRSTRWGNATLGDLLAALEEASGRDLAAWSKEWLETAGVNTLRPEFMLDADGRFTEFAVLQEAAGQPPGAAPAPHRDRPVRPDRGRAWPGGTGSRSTSPASAPRCRSWPASSSPTWCWSTTTT